jgi:hypothetical protein
MMIKGVPPEHLAEVIWSTSLFFGRGHLGHRDLKLTRRRVDGPKADSG